MTKFILIAALVALIPSSAPFDDFPGGCDPPLYFEGEELDNSQLMFSTKMAKTLINRERGNVIFSPYSTYRVLLLLFLGANGKTKQSLQTTLHLNWLESKDILQELYIEHGYQLLGQENGFSFVEKLYIESGAQLL